jgi:ribosome biogenesis protein ENP2
MEVFAPNGVKIYNISAGKTIPEWISEKRKKKLKKREGPEIK